jgi:DNA-binding response OmpR family regulator
MGPPFSFISADALGVPGTTAAKSENRPSFEIVNGSLFEAPHSWPKQRQEMSATSAPRARVLVVDDDATVSEILSHYLAREGFEVDTVADGSRALERAHAWKPDVVVLDLMLPGTSGLEICRRLRASEASSVPIIMLTARGEERERVFGLRLGADDYIVKPFSPREVAARVSSVLRRTNGRLVASADEPDTITAGEISLDFRGRSVHLAGEEVGLTPREFDLLAFLMCRPNQVISRGQLLEQVWGYSVGDAATVTVHVRRLRTKLERNPTQPRHIQTVWGVGYRFTP